MNELMLSFIYLNKFIRVNSCNESNMLALMSERALSLNDKSGLKSGWGKGHFAINRCMLEHITISRKKLHQCIIYQHIKKKWSNMKNVLD